MTRHSTALLAFAAVACVSACVVAPGSGRAQSATAVAHLNLDKLTGTWYQIAKLPVKSERKCVDDGTILYALNDRANSIQIGTFCTLKHGDHGNNNTSARMNKERDGKLKIRRLLIFSRPYWILATSPDYSWALVGTPNHKSLWILARQTTVSPELYTQLQDTAAAGGFPVGKLVTVPHPQDRVTLASPSATPSTIVTTTPGQGTTTTVAKPDTTIKPETTAPKPK